MNIIEEIEGKAIIWAHYQHDVKTIVNEIEKKHGPGSVVHYMAKRYPNNGTRLLKILRLNLNVDFLLVLHKQEDMD